MKQTTFVIGNIPYKVKTVEGYIEDKGKEYVGQIDYSKQIIQMSDKLEEQAFSKILLHEITHGLLQEYGMTKYNKEDFVDRLSTALYDFLSRNNLSFLRNTGGYLRNDSLDSLSYATKILGKQTPVSMTDTASSILSDVAPRSVKPSFMKSVEGDISTSITRPRKLPINNERSLSVKIADVVNVNQQKESKEPDFWTTGIKQKDGIDCYKTRYECVACGNKGTRYVPDDIDYVKCHECNKKMQKIPATMEGFPVRDSWGNFFIAGEVTMSEA